MPTFYKDTIATYSKCTIYDRLDSRLKYVKARVYLGTTEVTGSGTLSVNGQDVTWSAGSGFLGNKSNYNGAELKMVLTTQVTGIGSISNEATVNYCNARTTPVYTTPVPATINYYRDYQAGDTTPCYVDKTTNTTRATPSTLKPTRRRSAPTARDWTVGTRTPSAPRGTTAPGSPAIPTTS